MVRSVHGETSHAQAGKSSPKRLSSPISATVSPPPALSPPTAMRLAAYPSFREDAPRGQRVVARRRKWMLGGQAIGDGQRPHAPCPARFGRHPPVAQDGARAIAAAVKEHQHAGGVAAGRDRPFARHAAEISRLELHVVGDRPHGADLVNAAAALLPAHRPRLGAREEREWRRFRFGPPAILSFAAHLSDRVLGAQTRAQIGRGGHETACP